MTKDEDKKFKKGKLIEKSQKILINNGWEGYLKYFGSKDKSNNKRAEKKMNGKKKNRRFKTGRELCLFILLERLDSRLDNSKLNDFDTSFNALKKSERPVG